MFLYTSSKLSEREMKKTIQFTTASKRIKYLGINLIEEVKDLYLENYKTLMKEIEYDTNKWKDTSCSWIGRSNIVKMTILPKVIYRFNAIHIKIQMAFFTELEQVILKFVCSHKRPWLAKTILRKKNKAEGIIIPDFKLYYKVTLIKMLWCWQKTRHVDQWNRIESRDRSTLIWSINLQQRDKNIQWGKDSFFMNGVGKTVWLHTKKIKKKSKWTTFLYHIQK